MDAAIEAGVPKESERKKERECGFLILMFVCVVLYMFAPRLQAAEAAIIMGGSSWYPPFHYPDETTGLATGFDVAVAQTIASAIDRPLEFHFDNWNAVLQGNSFYMWIAAICLALALLSLYFYWSRTSGLKHRFSEQSRALSLAQQQLRTMQMTDHLSGLATRQYFLHRLEESLKDSNRRSRPLVVGMILVRDMGAIEHSLGPKVVDQLVAGMARQLESLQLGELGYFGSSRFVLMMNDIGDAGEAECRMQDVMTTLGRDFVIDGSAINVNPVAGFSIYPRDADMPEHLLRNAMVALNQAWSENRVLVEYKSSFDPDPVNYALMTDLRQALANGELSWVFQPQYDIQRAAIIGAEMLVRWDHPVQGMVPPDLFIPLAEQSDLIQLITRQALSKAVEVLSDWTAANRKLQLSVNVSPTDLADQSFVTEILALVGDHATSLTLEITEVAVAQNGDRLIDGVNRLKSAGVRISLDDYGTGYASLTHLKELNFDELKIDRSFTACISSNERLLRLTRASILLGLELGCQIVAEGVEDARTAALLLEQGCYLLQGYLVARPLSLATFNKFIDMPLAFEGHPFNRWGEPASIAGTKS